MTVIKDNPRAVRLAARGLAPTLQAAGKNCPGETKGQ
jgi:hypothetical protein